MICQSLCWDQKTRSQRDDFRTKILYLASLGFFSGAQLTLTHNFLGHVEEQIMSDHAFRAQHLSHAILGYSQNPSNDPSAQQFVGSLEAAKANGFNTVDVIRPSNASRRELKRKRKAKGDLEIVDGEGAYVGPWGGWEGENEEPEGLENYEEVEEEEESEAAKRADTRKASFTKRSVFGQETSIFHGKSLADYQGRTYMYPPLSVAPHLASETSEQECFIPKTCVHTFTGHTAGVSVIRLLPKTGHLMLSGSMDKKIKVVLVVFPRWAGNLIGAHSSIALGCISRGQLHANFHGSPPSCEGRVVF